MNAPKVLFERWWWVLLVCLAGALGLYFGFRRDAPGPSVTILAPNNLPPRRAPFLSRIIPMSPRWGWVWRWKDKILGSPKPVMLDADIFGLSESVESVSNFALPGPTLSDTHGLEVWLLTQNQVSEFRSRLQRVPAFTADSRFRAYTADGIQSTVFQGGKAWVNGSLCEVGKSVDFYPKVHRQSVDLTTVIRDAEAVTNRSLLDSGASESGTVSLQTNLLIAAQVRITNGGGVLLLNSRPGSLGAKPGGVLISVSQPAKK